MTCPFKDVLGYQFYWLVLSFREIILYGLVKTYNCIVFTHFQHTKFYSSLDTLIKCIIIEKKCMGFGLT